MTTPVSVVNYALEFCGAQTQLTSLTDNTIPGNPANIIYAPIVQMLLRQLNPDFARFQIPLSVAGGITPPAPWIFAYAYPADCLRVRQIVPPPPYGSDPQPVRGLVYFANPGGVKIIGTSQPNASLAYTTSLVTENQWDSQFLEAVARQLANPLSMAIAGRPDFAREILEEASRYEQMAEFGDESMAQAV